MINITLWQVVKNFFNDNRHEVYVTRKDLINHLKSMVFEGNIWLSSFSTMDCYRNYLDKSNYLKQVARGIYKVIKEIPYDLSLNDVRLEAYGNRHELSFSDTEEFIKEDDFRI